MLWTDKCPVCKNGKLKYTQKKGFLGLTTSQMYECDKCKSIFQEKKGKYQLTKSPQPHPIWDEYGNIELTEREWINITQGGMSDEKQSDTDINSWLTDAKNGQISFAKIDSPIILKKNEKAILCLDNISFFEPRAVRKTKGAYGGPTFRVAKGVSFRMGAFQAQSTSHEELKQIDNGTLTLTNKRMIFTGNKRTTTIDLKKLINIEPFRDGIASQRENKQKTEHFTGINKTIITITANQREYTIPINGIVLKSIIEGLITKI